MDYPLPQNIRVGGSALPDGVMMLTPLAFATARLSPLGGFDIQSFPLPQRAPSPLDRLPFVRVIPKLVSQMYLVVTGWKPRSGRIPVPLLIGAVLLALLSVALNFILAFLPAFWHAFGSSALQLALLLLFIGATRLIPQMARIWRFHGGEHQAIGAYEAGLDLSLENAQASTLYHPRCGTNLATLAILLMVPGMVAGSVVSGPLGYLITLLVPLIALCVAFEIVMIGQKRLKAVLWPGLAFQRLTVARPGNVESMAGIAALEAVLFEHQRVLDRQAAASRQEEPVKLAG